MKNILAGRSRRWGHDAWAVRVRGSKLPMPWTVCTTRQEAREVRRDPRLADLFDHAEVVKVRIKLEVVDG